MGATDHVADAWPVMSRTMTSVEDSVKKWLASHGLPLEMRASAILRESGVSPSHYRTYADPETGKVREIDLIGYIDQSRISTHLVLECKHSREKPWVMFTTSNHCLTPAGYAMADSATPVAESILEVNAQRTAIQNLVFFRRPPSIGFRLMRAHTDNQDSAFQATSGLASACFATAREIGASGHSVIYVPVVIVDAPLFLARPGEASVEVELERVTQATLMYSRGFGDHLTIHVVHVDVLADFARLASRHAAKLNRLVQ